MKNNISRLITVLAAALQLACCGDISPSMYTLELPQTPEIWVSLLGEPHWRLEWLDPGGNRRTTDILPVNGAANRIEIELPVTWANPITAWPFWPDRNLIPGFFRPAGALFPFDVSGNRLCLSWEAGPDTIFYWELALANNGNFSKIPANFDWPRFRELFTLETLSEKVLEDPWLVNWRSVAERTISSNFDRRRLVPEAAEDVNIPVSSGRWYGTSPFAPPLYFEEGETPAFPVRPGINVWVSNEGILRISGKTWMFSR